MIDSRFSASRCAHDALIKLGGAVRSGRCPFIAMVIRVGYHSPVESAA